MPVHDVETIERLDDSNHRLLRDGRDSTLPANHPINALSSWRKLAILLTLSYSGFLANFSVAIIQVAFPEMGATFGVSPGKIPNTIGYNLLGVAVGPLFWNPLSRTIGRRPVYLLGSLLFIPCTVWMALSPSYVVFSVARVVAGLVSSFSQTVPPATVADIFVKQVRGSKMSMFGVAVVIAPAVAPVFCGLVVNSLSWRILFWIICGLAGLQLVLFYFIVPETLWVQDYPASTSTAMDTVEPESVGNGNIESESQSKAIEERIEDSRGSGSVDQGHCGAAWYPWHRPGEYFALFLSPINMIRYIPITVASFYYGSLFAWSVGITIVMPQKFEKAPYNFHVIPLGAAFLAFGIGGLLGKWSGGIVGDKVVSYCEKRKGSRQPEHRLWALIPILPFMFVGCIICGVTIQQQLHWIAYLIGGGLFFYCLSATTGLLQTFVLECDIARSMDTQAVFNFWKSMWGFAIAFFVYDWGENYGFVEEYAIQGALATGVGAMLCAILITQGMKIRRWQGLPVTEA